MPAPKRVTRQSVAVITPCEHCAHTGLCAIEEQIEENLVLTIVEIARPIVLALHCSEFQRVKQRRSRRPWTPEQRSHFEATIEARKNGHRD